MFGFRLRRKSCGSALPAQSQDRHSTFANKSKALDQLARHLQMFKDTVVVENVFQVIQEMSDEELDRRIRELEDAIAGQATLNPASGTSPEKLH